MEKLLTISEAANIINLHPETLRRWDREGTLVAVKVNDRGDRRYRESDIMEFMKTHKSTILHTQSISYSGYVIKWWNDNGFITTQGNFDLLAKMYATKNNEFIGFVFYVSFLDKFKSEFKEDDLDKLAISAVKKYFDTKKPSDGDRFTFEFNSSRFYEVQNPEWWEEKYSKTLVPGLRVEAHSTHPTNILNKAWRVILHFKSLQADQWTITPFGSDHNLHEYFVWIDSKELVRLGLPNTAKGAEILAIDFGIKRFEEAKDNKGDWDITRIVENNTAFFNGKYVKNSVLPEEKI